ncbi:hypothetical protein [Bacteroides sp.]|uniref:hypothetical protein n=1 Tax=Bacteroides sp. TaxID=29523 RepID=UPI00261B598E|nr:hypothetical protein [Bacteroides sp.]MDD3039917.1 hypothetical protein [Bacteroides sp.]
MKKEDFRKIVFLLLAGFFFASCQYTAKDYVADMKALTTKVIKNGSNYTSEDWKEVTREYQELNKKGKQVIKNLTQEQQKELKEWKEEMMKEASKFDSKELKETFNNLMDQANDFIKDTFKKE